MPADLLMSPYVIGWLAASLGLVPLAWLAWLYERGHVRDVGLWWVAVAFGVSFVADFLAFFVAPDRRWFIGVVYPVSQAALIGAALLPRKSADMVLSLLLVTAVVAVLWRGVSGPDVLLRTVAFGAVAAMAFTRRDIGPLRPALLIYFGVGVLAWWCNAFAPGWWTWGAWQLTRAAGIGLVCRAFSAGHV